MCLHVDTLFSFPFSLIYLTIRLNRFVMSVICLVCLFYSLFLQPFRMQLTNENELLRFSSLCVLFPCEWTNKIVTEWIHILPYRPSFNRFFFSSSKHSALRCENCYVQKCKSIIRNYNKLCFTRLNKASNTKRNMFVSSFPTTCIAAISKPNAIKIVS